MNQPAVTTTGKKIRLEAKNSDPYDLDLYQAQELASDLILAIEKLNGYYTPPQTTTTKRTLRLSPRRTVRVSQVRSKHGIRLHHQAVLIVEQDQANDLIEIIVSATEQAEDYADQSGVDPYEGLNQGD